MATALVPGIYDESLADEQIEVATENAQQMVLRWRARKVCWSAYRPAPICSPRCRSPGGSSDGVVVTIFSDSAAKYLVGKFLAEIGGEAETWP